MSYSSSETPFSNSNWLEGEIVGSTPTGNRGPSIEEFEDCCKLETASCRPSIEEFDDIFFICFAKYHVACV